MYGYISEENLIELEKFNAWKKQQAIHEVFAQLGAMIRPAYRAAGAIARTGSAIASGARAVGSAVTAPVRGAISAGRTIKNIGAGLIDPAKEVIGGIGSALKDVHNVEKDREMLRQQGLQDVRTKGLKGAAARSALNKGNVHAAKAYGGEYAKTGRMDRAGVGDRLRFRIAGALDQARQNIGAAVGPAKPGAGLLSRVARSAGGALFDTAKQAVLAPTKLTPQQRQNLAGVQRRANRPYGQPVRPSGGGIFGRANQDRFASNFMTRFMQQPEQ
jgi:hypothetical protein